jgi:adenine-specific DNA-methyltransferase
MTDTKSMEDHPEHIDLSSLDVTEDKRQALLALFPDIRTEAGKINFDQLKSELGETVDIGRERYGLTWPGKAACMRTIQSPSMATLRPVPGESVDFEMSENLIIEGDNLEVLKLLQKSYLGKVKLIYIDPPYNTGNDFIYPDNYSETLQTYLEYTGQVDDIGRKFGSNSDADGRFHSKWLNMMYPRLYLARNLLRDDGLACISISDTEIENLKLICNELFGEENHRGTIVRATGQTTGQDGGGLGSSFDYVLVYSRNCDSELSGLPLSEDDLLRYQDEDSRGKYALWQLRKTGSNDRRIDRPTMYFRVVDPDGNDVWPLGPTGYESCWRFDPKGYAKLVANDYIVWKRRDKNGGGGSWWPYVKTYLEGRSKRPSPLWTDIEGSKKATRDLRSIMGEDVFDNPKPVGLIRRLIEILPQGVEPTIVLDFFAGSGSTAHAVLEQNKQDGGNRKYILVQLPERTGRDDYQTIADITKERMRRVIRNLNAEDTGKLGFDTTPQDRGFRVFKLAESNFKPWDVEVEHDEASLGKQLELHVDHVRDQRSQDDLLNEILLKSGFPLTTSVETIDSSGKQIYSVADGSLVICLDRELTLVLIRTVASMKPERAVFLDEGFAGNDQLKTNAVQIFKSNGVTTFKTV